MTDPSHITDLAPADTDPRHDDGANLSIVAAWTCFVAVLVAIRLLLPFTPTAAALTHGRIADALLGGLNWGRQALIGSFEFPPLPTLSLVAAKVAGGWIGISGERLLVACCQVWALACFLTIPERPRRAWLAAACLGFAFLAPDLRAAFMALDPNWIAVVPLCYAVKHLLRWNRDRQLRDAIVCALCAGLLVFCGLVGIAFAVTLMATLGIQERRCANSPTPCVDGLGWLLWTPLCYCVALWLLWNWLIMGDVGFAFRCPAAAWRGATAGELRIGLTGTLKQTSVLVLGGAIAWLLCLRGSLRRPSVCLLAGLMAASLARALMGAAQVPAPGTSLLPLGLGLLGLTLPCLVLDWRRNRWLVLATAYLLAFCTVAAMRRPADPFAADQAARLPAPSAESLCAFIDTFWPDSRIMVYGTEVPALYHDLHERRFVARLDFREQEFLAQANDEQLHLLVPPPDGWHCPRRGGVFSDIHANGRPWLLLERQWPTGWQLWRCVIAPKGESKIDRRLRR